MIQMTKAMDEGYANYKRQNPCVSEYMEVDFKAGFRRGYEAAKADSDLREYSLHRPVLTIHTTVTSTLRKLLSLQYGRPTPS